jgi:hypothetical protein
MRTDMDLNDDAQSFAEDTTRRKTPPGDPHRLQTRTLGVKRIRTMLRKTVHTLIAWATSERKIHTKQMAAIDITKGNLWGGEVTYDG